MRQVKSCQGSQSDHRLALAGFYEHGRFSTSSTPPIKGARDGKIPKSNKYKKYIDVFLCI